MNTPAVALVVLMGILCGYLIDYEKKQQEIGVVNCHGEVPITVKLVDGKELYPVKTYANQADVQLIMSDGRAITMAWAQIELIKIK
jgi:predicted ATP-grasp superfamily ATP-dependent carboligase